MKNLAEATGRSLREIEAQVWAEGQEWMRLRQELPQEADRHGRVFSPRAAGGPGTPKSSRCTCAPVSASWR